MAEIEFVEDEPDDEPDYGPDGGADQAWSPNPGGPRAPAARSRIVAGVLLLAAAGLLVATPFGTVFRLGFTVSDGSPDDVDNTSVDGWGRIDNSLAEAHSTRFGIALCALAGVVLVAALLTLLPRVDGPGVARLRRWAPGVLLAVLGAVTGLLGAAALELQSQLDSAALRGGDGQRLTITAGAFFWLGAAALVVLGVALAVSHGARLKMDVHQGGDVPAQAPQADLGHD